MLKLDYSYGIKWQQLNESKDYKLFFVLYFKNMNQWGAKNGPQLTARLVFRGVSVDHIITECHCTMSSREVLDSTSQGLENLLLMGTKPCWIIWERKSRYPR